MLEKLKNKAKIAVNSWLFAGFSKLTLLLTPLTYIHVGDKIIELLKRMDMDTKYALI